ncbi:S8 family peptidase [Natronomonas marina]|jgi:hypothetical protein|uniref:S8 family peptidase n=1 Tax=Natronomonas marina TaxID=2961939 RepID=UPI0020C97C03|nr:S8 family serine peptidase [Natronomonas marina]
MDYSRRETLALGGGVAAGFLAGGLLGLGARRDGEPKRRIVGTRDEAAVSEACEAVAGDERVIDLEAQRTLVVGPLDEAAAADLATAEAVDYVEPDLPVAAADAGRRPAPLGQRRRQWALDRIDAPAAHEAGHRGEGVRVAVIDSGVATHPDIAPNLADGIAFVDCTDGCSAPWTDDAGHGTGCAGVIAAAGDLLGVAPGATVHPVKVLDAEKAGRVSLVAAGIRWAVDRGCSVVNLSISGPIIRAYEDAVRHAAEHDVLVVASAGNVGPCSDCLNPLSTHPEVVAVTATTREDDFARFSATGPEAELAAPGAAITTTGLGQYVTVNGTSFSAPHVAGAAALCRGAGHSAAATRALLAETAETLTLSADEQGSGLVDAAAALVPTVRTLPPERNGRRVTFRGQVPRIEGEAATVRFEYRWRFGRRWRTTPARRLTRSGRFEATVRLRRLLTYRVRALAEFDDGTTVRGDGVRVRVPVSLRQGGPVTTGRHRVGVTRR